MIRVFVLLMMFAASFVWIAGCSDDVEGEEVPTCDEVCGADAACMATCRPPEVESEAIPPDAQ